jgi:hypothetical protein
MDKTRTEARIKELEGQILYSLTKKKNGKKEVNVAKLQEQINKLRQSLK